MIRYLISIFLKTVIRNWMNRTERFFFLENGFIIRIKVLHFPTLRDHNWNFGLIIWSSRYILNFPNNKQTIQNPSKYYMFPIKKVTLGTSYEKLGTIGVTSTVGLKFKTKTTQFQQLIIDVLHIKFFFSIANYKQESYTIDRRPGESCFRLKFSSSNVSPYMLMHPVPSPWKPTRKFKIKFLLQVNIWNEYIDEVSSLYHKVFDDSMKWGGFETSRYTILFELSSTKLPKVFCCFRYNIGKQFYYDPANFLGYENDNETTCLDFSLKTKERLKIFLEAKNFWLKNSNCNSYFH